MAFQHSHSTTPFSKSKFPIIVLCDGLRSPANIGGLFRICEAFGVEKILFHNGNVDVNSPRLKKTARETYKNVDYGFCEDINATVNGLIKKGYEVIALEISNISVSSKSITLDKKALVLVIGNEQFGVSEEILALAPKHMHIEMYGKNSSMNVVQATGIALYSLVNMLIAAS